MVLGFSSSGTFSALPALHLLPSCSGFIFILFIDCLKSISSLQRISQSEFLPCSAEHSGGGKPSHGKPADGAKHFGAGNQSCQADFSCIIPDILSSPAIPGNIADIVELLKKISQLLSANVTRGKMLVLTFIWFGRCFWASGSIHKYFVFMPTDQ